MSHFVHLCNIASLCVYCDLCVNCSVSSASNAACSGSSTVSRPCPPLGRYISLWEEGTRSLSSLPLPPLSIHSRQLCGSLAPHTHPASMFLHSSPYRWSSTQAHHLSSSPLSFSPSPSLSPPPTPGCLALPPPAPPCVGSACLPLLSPASTAPFPPALLPALSPCVRVCLPLLSPPPPVSLPPTAAGWGTPRSTLRW